MAGQQFIVFVYKKGIRKAELFNGVYQLVDLSFRMLLGVVWVGLNICW